MTTCKIIEDAECDALPLRLISSRLLTKGFDYSVS